MWIKLLVYPLVAMPLAGCYTNANAPWTPPAAYETRWAPPTPAPYEQPAAYGELDDDVGPMPVAYGRRPGSCIGPNRVYSAEAGGCVVRVTNPAELNRVAPRMPIGTDPKCTGNAGYWTTVPSRHGPMSIHRTCVYRN
jgi:hypothetical protein